MLRFAVLRILTAIPTLLFVIVAAFLMVHAAPGGPFADERVLPPETARNLEAAYRLDEPLPRQLARYLGGLLRADLGPSYHYRDYTVAELIGNSVPVSFRLGLAAMAAALAVGVAAGVLAALNRNSIVDRVVTGFALVGISVPVIVMAPLFVLVFAVKLGWLPASFGGGLRGYVLPVTALALPQIAFIARITRSGMADALASDYVRTARAQGLSRATIVRRHALKPAMLPVVSWLGPALALVLTGAVVVETVFGVPGLGQLFVRAGLNRDYTLVLGIVIFYAAVIIALNVLVDLAYGFLDPRIRHR